MSGNGPDSDPELVCATDIEPVATDWWWPGWLPKGKLVLLDGNPGTGKSTLALDVVARLSRGESFPTSDTTASCRSAVISTEDAADDTIRPRLDAAGARLDMVDVWDWESTSPSFPDSCVDGRPVRGQPEHHRPTARSGAPSLLWPQRWRLQPPPFLPFLQGRQCVDPLRQPSRLPPWHAGRLPTPLSGQTSSPSSTPLQSG